MRATTLSCTLALTTVFAAEAAAHDLHVPAAHATIQAAIDAARPGDSVIVAPGTYSGAGNRDLDFGGKAITVRSADGPARTVLAVGATPDAPARGVLFVSGEGPDAVLDGFTITGGATLPGAIDDQFNGGGILVNNGSSPTIRNCVLRGNQCGCWGAGICVTNASPLIVDCRIVNNTADDNGGGVFAWGSGAPVIVNTLIAGNDGGVTGGGVALFGTSTTILNSTIVGNTASFAPGMDAHGATIANSIVWGHGETPIWGTSEISFSAIEGGYDGPGNVDLDPMFADAAGGDYHLQSDSPLIDAGDSRMVPVTVLVDFDGDPRIIGGGVDMGADEMLIPGDVDFNGAVDVNDLVQVVLAWGACDACPEDVTKDGIVDVSDLVTLIVNWTN